MGKLLTVSVAAYNVEKYLGKVLDSFTNDCLNEYIEVFVVDDGGKDNSLNIAKTYAEKYPQIFIPIHKENGGWGSTVNYSLQHASGKYFKLLDGDDYFEPEAVIKFIDFLKNCDSDFIVTPYTKFEDETNRIVDVVNNPNCFEDSIEYDFTKIADNTPIEMWSSTFKTSVIKDNIKITEHCFYTDGEFVVKAATRCKTVSFCNINLYQYRVARDGQSVSHAGYRKHWRDLQIVVENIYKDNLQVNISDEINKMYLKRMQQMINSQYNVYLLLKPSTENKTELIQYDAYIKENFCDNYINSPKYVKLARAMNFNGFTCMVGLRYVIHFLRRIDSRR